MTSSDSVREPSWVSSPVPEPIVLWGFDIHPEDGSVVAFLETPKQAFEEASTHFDGLRRCGDIPLEAIPVFKLVMKHLSPAALARLLNHGELDHRSLIAERTLVGTVPAESASRPGEQKHRR